jgi:hypothetical protein
MTVYHRIAFCCLLAGAAGQALCRIGGLGLCQCLAEGLAATLRLGLGERLCKRETREGAAAGQKSPYVDRLLLAGRTSFHAEQAGTANRLLGSNCATC